MRFDDEFAQRLQSIRSEKGLSQQDLSRISGVAQAQLSRYEAGTNKPRPHVLAKLAQVLGVSATWLSSGDIPFSSNEDFVSFTIRAPFGLVDSLRQESQASGRSLDEEVISRLEASFHPDVLGLKTGELIDALLDRFPSGHVSVRIGKIDEDDDQE